MLEIRLKFCNTFLSLAQIPILDKLSSLASQSENTPLHIQITFLKTGKLKIRAMKQNNRVRVHCAVDYWRVWAGDKQAEQKRFVRETKRLILCKHLWNVFNVFCVCTNLINVYRLLLSFLYRIGAKEIKYLTMLVSENSFEESVIKVVINFY